MSNCYYIQGASTAQHDTAEISNLYAKQFSWSEGRRLPDESKLVHLTCAQALLSSGIDDKHKLVTDTGIVLSSPYGGLSSYERFHATIDSASGLQPLAFSYSLPSIPASVLSIYYGITAPVVTLAAPTEQYYTASILSACQLLDANLCKQVIVGSWTYPSNTSRYCNPDILASASIALISSEQTQDTGLLLSISKQPSEHCSNDDSHTTDRFWHNIYTMSAGPENGQHLSTEHLSMYFGSIENGDEHASG